MDQLFYGDRPYRLRYLLFARRLRLRRRGRRVPVLGRGRGRRGGSVHHIPDGVRQRRGRGVRRRHGRVRRPVPHLVRGRVGRRRRRHGWSGSVATHVRQCPGSTQQGIIQTAQQGTLWTEGSGQTRVGRARSDTSRAGQVRLDQVRKGQYERQQTF